MSSPCVNPPKKSGLLAKILTRLFVGLILASAILFLPAGTFRFWQAWVYLCILFFPVCGAYFYFLKHDPQLVERRLENRERVGTQRKLVRILAPFFFAVFLLPGFDYRFGWSRGWLGEEPLWLTLLSQALALSGMLSACWVIQVNRFASRTIHTEAGQTVISTGPYRLVRHPMYSGSIVLFLFTPLALGSIITLPAFAALIPFYVLRLLNEEELRAELPGYTEYCMKTRYRLMPLVW